MKQLLITLGFILVITISFGQYNDPYRMAYDGNNHYITNKGNGTVTKLTSSGSTSTVISGLHSPNDIFYGAVAGNSVVIILDSNTIKIYDSASLGSLLSIPITNCVEAHDGMFNPNNTNEFFISDRGGNKIIKGTIGSAPFYPITFSTFVTNIIKPAGMIVNSQGRLIVVSDTINANVYEVNLSTGNKSIVLSTSQDNFNDVAQDNEGNYYITCWGNSNLYRYGNTWTSPTVVSTFNHPSGLYADLNNDLLGIVCTNCQKVEFKFFHLFSPASDANVCTEDSFYVSFVPSYQGIGTYNSGNRFNVEMSDSNGNFTNSVVIGSIISSTPPTTMNAALPIGHYADTGHLYRLASTSPIVHSYFSKNLYYHPRPEAIFYGGDSLYGCINNPVPLKFSYDSQNQYSMFPPVGFHVVGSGLYTVTSSMDGEFGYAFQAQDTLTGCADVQLYKVFIQNSFSLDGLADSATICQGDTLNISSYDRPFMYNWTGSTDISSSSSAQPKFFGSSDTWIDVSITDSTQVCSGSDSIYINVKAPIDFVLQDTASVCVGDSVEIGIDNKPYVFKWSNTADLTSSSSSNPKFFGMSSTIIHVEVEDSLGQCLNLEDSLYAIVNELPQVSFTTQEDIYCLGDSVHLIDFEDDSMFYVHTASNQSDFINGSWLSDSVDRFPYEINYTSKETGCSNIFGNAFNVLNIPDSVIISISTNRDFLEGQVFGSTVGANIGWYINGNMVHVGDTIHTNRFSDGDSIYAIHQVATECDKESNSIIWEILSISKPSIDFRVKPNPSNGQFSIVTINQIEQVSIYDLNGKLVHQNSKPVENKIITIGLSGLYILEVQTTEGIGRKRILVH